MKLKTKIISVLLAALMLIPSAPAMGISPQTACAASAGSKLYLSDLPSTLISSSVGYSTIKYDTNIDGGMISLIVDGKRRYFLKGISAHAAANLVYDFSDYSQAYSKFTAYLGLDYTAEDIGTGVKYTIYNSSNNSDWTVVKTTGVLKGNTESEKLELDITSAPYVKIIIDSNGNNTRDHSVLAGAMLTASDYTEPSDTVDFIKTPEQYASELASYGSDYASLIENEDYRKLLYQKEIVENTSYDLIQTYARENENYLAALKWLFNDFEALDMFVNGSTPEKDSYGKAIEVMTKLYTAHKDDMSNSLYKRMLITLSLTHSSTVYFWADSTQISDPLKRYESYKNLYDNGYLVNEVFENLTVSEMRWVMGSISDDEEIEWLNYYIRKYKNGGLDAPVDYTKSAFNPYSYIKYLSGYNYYLPKYYSEENKDSWQNKYHLVNTEEADDDDIFDINITYAENHPKLWIVWEEGAVCGGISKTGENILTAFGVPGAVIGQPGHAAYLKYNLTDKSDGTSDAYWDIWNDVSGWSKSSRGEWLLNGWGNESWVKTYNVGYLPLAQEALNNYAGYIKAEDLCKIAELFSDDTAKATEIYKYALTIQNYNLDVWEGLTEVYKNANAENTQWLELAAEAKDALTYYPTAMYDVLNSLILPNVTDNTVSADIKMYINSALKKATTATADNCLHYNASKTIANYLLGNNSSALASFSFDGDNANKIVLSDGYTAEGTELLYSLDKGNSWSNAGTVNSYELSADELASITADNGIMVKLQGSSTSCTIDITEGTVPTSVYANDNENKLVGAASYTEYSLDRISWQKLTSGDIFAGDKTVYVRNGAHSTVLAGEPVEYNFTDNKNDYNYSYISISDISIINYSSEQANKNQYAANTIDGNINTIWHTNWTANSDMNRYISYKFSEPRYLSAVKYTPSQSDGNNGRFTSCDIYTSDDGESWTLAASADNWAVDKSSKTIVLDKPVYTQYVKVTARNAYANFASAAMIEFYEDLTNTRQINNLTIAKKPDKLEYKAGESLDLSGMQIYAVLDDSSVVELDGSNYTVSGFDSTSKGSKAITIALKSDPNIKTQFDISVSGIMLAITKQPQSALYSIGESIAPLETDIHLYNNNSNISYQWYLNGEPIENAVYSSYTPTVSGSYYVKISDGEDYINSDTAVITIGDYAVSIGAVGYTSLSEAAEAAESGDIITVRKDLSIDSAITIDKSINIDGNGYTLSRAEAFTDDSIFNVTSELVLINITLDGGALWTSGNYNATLSRNMGNSGVQAARPLISITNGKLTLKKDAVLQNNFNAGNYTYAGGAVSASGTSTVTLDGGTIQNNFCSSFGGAVMLKNNSALNIISGAVKGNAANNSGGTVCIDHSSALNMTGGSITNNLGYGNGGVFWLSNGSISLNGGLIKNNGDSTIYLNGSGSVNINNADTLNGSIQSAANKKININCNISGKSIVFIPIGSITDYAKIASVSNAENAASAAASFSCSNYIPAVKSGAVYLFNKKYDLNNDSLINRADAADLLKYLASLSSDADSSKADINNDGTQDLLDAAAYINAIS